MQPAGGDSGSVFGGFIKNIFGKTETKKAEPLETTKNFQQDIMTNEKAIEALKNKEPNTYVVWKDDLLATNGNFSYVDESKRVFTRRITPELRQQIDSSKIDFSKLKSEDKAPPKTLQEASQGKQYEDLKTIIKEFPEQTIIIVPFDGTDYAFGIVQNGQLTTGSLFDTNLEDTLETFKRRFPDSTLETPKGPIVIKELLQKSPPPQPLPSAALAPPAPDFPNYPAPTPPPNPLISALASPPDHPISLPPLPSAALQSPPDHPIAFPPLDISDFVFIPADSPAIPSALLGPLTEENAPPAQAPNPLDFSDFVPIPVNHPPSIPSSALRPVNEENVPPKAPDQELSNAVNQANSSEAKPATYTVNSTRNISDLTLQDVQFVNLNEEAVNSILNNLPPGTVLINQQGTFDRFSYKRESGQIDHIVMFKTPSDEKNISLYMGKQDVYQGPMDLFFESRKKMGVITNLAIPKGSGNPPEVTVIPINKYIFPTVDTNTAIRLLSDKPTGTFIARQPSSLGYKNSRGEEHVYSIYTKKSDGTNEGIRIYKMDNEYILGDLDPKDPNGPDIRIRAQNTDELITKAIAAGRLLRSI